MDTVFIAVFSITSIGAVCAIILSIASKLMYVKIDERIEKIQRSLPGTNCGGCGFPGCSIYASSLVEVPGVKNNLCIPGGAALIKQISEILGVKAEAVISKTAIIHCGGDLTERQKKMVYKGIESCSAAKEMFGGEAACTSGCLGYGDCQAACPSQAICLESGLAHINVSLCMGCGLCVKTCPNGIISIEEASIKVLVACSNTEKGAIVRKKCANCCLGCSKCVRECPEAAIKIENNLAIIDYERCTGCGHCAEICVNNCIQKFGITSEN